MINEMPNFPEDSSGWTIQNNLRHPGGSFVAKVAIVHNSKINTPYFVLFICNF
jgi:hypothetical protein